MNDDVKTVIRDFVVSTYLQGESPDNLRDDTSLITSGILDSLAVLGLVSFLEQRFSIELDVYDTSIERFDRIIDIAATVCVKQEAHAVRAVVR
jgi:acyl carrier protein